MTTKHQKVKEFITSHPRGVLATVSPGLVPHVAAIYVHVDEELRFYFVTKSETRKCKNVADNNAVTLAFVDDGELIYIEATGRARPVYETEMIATLIGKLERIIEQQQENYWLPPIAQLAAGQYVFYEVTPHQIRYTKFAKAATKEAHLHERFELSF